MRHLTRLGILVGVLVGARPLTAQSPGFEFQLGGIWLSAKENVKPGGSSSAAISRGAGSLLGGDFLLRASGAGLAGRYVVGDLDPSRGTFPAHRLHLADARLMIGPRSFALEGGANYRRLEISNPDSVRQWLSIRAGARSAIAIGASGLHTVLAGAYVPYVVEDGGRSGGSGWEWEVGLSYSRRGIPLYVSLGYRYQTFQPETTKDAPQSELGGVYLAGGLHLGR